MMWKQVVYPRTNITSRWFFSSLMPASTLLLQYVSEQPCSRLYWRSVLTSSNYIRFLHKFSSRNATTSTDVKNNSEIELSTKDQLFYVDTLTDAVVPRFLSDRKPLLTLLKICRKDVTFDDSIFNRHIKYCYFQGIDKLMRHISYTQLYFSLLRAASRFESFHYNFVIFQEEDVVEGALDIRLNKDGQIYKINNRPVNFLLFYKDRKCAAVISKLKAASEAETTEAPSPVMLRTMCCHLRNFAAPSSMCLFASRAYSSMHGNGPEMFQLEHVRKRVEITNLVILFIKIDRICFQAPMFFRYQADYTIYRPNVIYKDEIFHLTVPNRDILMIYFGTISTACLFCCPHIELEVLSILPISEDGTVRLRWRVKYISLLRALLNPKLFKYEYRIKRLKWYDGLTIFHVGADGFVHRVVTRRIIDDEQKSTQANRLANLAQKVGVLPKSSVAFSEHH
ncbi:unnamed protein product [Thelazia callipaeda]|uniref:Uncharacterized protein n=1 Tax=Thelazia callipaeda TaxID=103827 RepID=A0A0N5D9M6_THECL|nr:unnamed protein product [Thelazia callipaeda]